MLTLERVVAGYGSTICVHHVSLDVQAGEIVAVLGANGAGKTTMLMAISGLVRPRQGAIVFNGVRLDRLSPAAIAAQGVGHIPEGRRMFARLTVLEHLQLGAYVRPRSRRDRGGVEEDMAKMWGLFPILRDRQQQLAGTLSGGEQQMLAIARGLMARPKLLLLDEPSLGLAPKLVAQVFERIARIHAEGLPILLVEQNARMALQVASRAYILETGAIAMHGPAAALAADPRVKAAYLGG
jgi:branched-chain amino acid transport system ATP-binding protein